jgi:hypothetical protein
MRFLKKTQKRFGENYSICIRGKSSLIIWATSVIFEKLPKENSHPIGKNSHNLVTLFTGKKRPLFSLLDLLEPILRLLNLQLQRQRRGRLHTLFFKNQK